MWPFRKSKTLKVRDLLAGFTDWHSHILPGVDDGVPTLEETLAVLHCYEALGVAEVWCTPHIMEDIPNTTAALRDAFAQLCAAYTGPLRLHLGAEHMLDNLFEERFAREDVLPLGAGRLLVETSYFNPPMGLYHTLERIKSRGYTPVLAHPERYLYMGPDDYRRLKAAGVAFQLNLPSLLGLYGRHIREKAEWLNDRGFCDYLGSDLHDRRMIQHFLE